MADNIVAGGNVVSADEINGVKHQRVKLQFGADGSAEDVSDLRPLPVTSAVEMAGLRADIAALQAAVDAINSTTVIEVVLSLSATPYASGDVLAATQEVAGALRVAGGAGVIQSLTVLDADHQGVPLEFYVFRSNVALGVENEVISISDADAADILGVIRVERHHYVDLAGSYLANQRNVSLPVLADAGTSLWLAAAIRGAATFLSGALVVKLGILQD